MNLLITTSKILNQREKLNLFLIFILITISSFLEMIGIGLILPLLTIIVDNNFFYNNEIVNIIKLKLNIENKSQFVILIIALLIIANLLKALFLTLTAWKQARDISNIHIRFTNKLYLDYINSPWEFLVNKNSGTLLRNIHMSTHEFTSKILVSYIQIASEVMMLSFVISMLLILQFKMTILAIFFFSFAGFVAQKITKKYNFKFGEIRNKNLQLINKHLIETFRSFKLIRTFNKEKIFSKNYLDISSKEIMAKTSQDIFNKLPRIWIEFFSIFTICLVTIMATKYNENFSSLIPIIGLFVAAAYKLLPSLTRILNTMQNFRFAKPAVLDLEKEMNEINKKLDLIKMKDKNINKNQINFNKNILIKNVYFSYGDSKQNVFENFSYEIEKNKVLGIIGASGSGKSTLVDLLMGISSPKSGKILIDGKDDIKDSTRYWQSKIGYVPQETYLLDESIKSNIAFGIPENQIDIKKIEKIITSIGLREMIENLSEGINSKVGDNGVKISGGQKQRLGIARALYISPQIMILDEATSALDVKNEQIILELINNFKNEISIIIVSHRQTIFPYCNKILNLDEIK